ncbi:10596_t:CDS:1, partial [Scutellospora calospora]
NSISNHKSKRSQVNTSSISEEIIISSSTSGGIITSKELYLVVKFEKAEV